MTMSSVEAPMIIWRSSRDCGLNCRHCSTPPNDKPELSPDRKRALIREIAAMPRRFFSLEGNDPDLAVLLDEMQKTGLQASLALSGTNYQFELLTAYAERIKYLHFSLDGHTSLVHDAIRGVKGNFQEVVSKIRLFGGAGLKIFVTCAAANWNLDSVVPLARLLADLPVAVFCVNIVTPFGRAANEPDPSVPPDVWQRLGHELAEFGSTQNKLQLLFEPGWSHKDSRDNPSCALFDRRFCIIDGDGSVYYCPLLMDVDKGSQALGSLRDNRLATIWSDEVRWRSLVGTAERGLAEICLDCSKVSWCRGGCPAFRLARLQIPPYCEESAEVLPICCMHRRNPEHG